MACYAQTPQKITYTYDALNRLTQVLYPNGSIINYNYDVLGNRNTVVNVSGCTVATATLSGTQTITAGQSATLSVALTGASPWSVVVNGVSYGGITVSPYTFSVSPSATTTYTISSVSNSCGAGTFSGSAVVTVNAVCPNQADFVVTDIVITRYTPERIYYTVQIKNQGSVAASLGSFMVGAYTSSDALVNSNDFWQSAITTGGNTLAAGQTTSFSYWTGFNFTNNRYYLRLQADYLNSTIECRETNNDMLKLVNQCTANSGLNLVGNLSGFYSSNSTVNIANATFSGYSLVVGKSIIGLPRVITQNSAFIVGNCLNLSAARIALIETQDSTPTESELIFAENQNSSDITFKIVKDQTAKISIWGDSEKAIIQEIAADKVISKGINSLKLDTTGWLKSNTYIIHIETSTGHFAKVIEW